MGTASDRLRAGLHVARFVEHVELTAGRRLRFKPGERSCTYCGHSFPPELEAEDGVGVVCTDLDACLARHVECSDPPVLGWLAPLKAQGDAALVALSQVKEGLLALTAQEADQTPGAPPAQRPYHNHGHLISGDPEHHRAAMLGAVRHHLDLAGHAGNRRALGYGRTVRGGPPAPQEPAPGAPDPGGQAPPEVTRQRQRQARARTLTSPRAVAKRAAARRKKAARSR